MDWHAMAISSLRKHIKEAEAGIEIQYKAEEIDRDLIATEMDKLVEEGKIKDLVVTTETANFPEHGDIEFVVFTAKVA